MGHREAREVAKIRHELRARLLSEHHEGAWEILARLLELAQDEKSPSQLELRGEYERWKVRFDLLVSDCPAMP